MGKVDIIFPHLKTLLGVGYPFFIDITLLIIGSMFLLMSLVMARQSWVRTFSHAATLILLPIVTYAITKAISNNVALSLGMVGALSLIRFRNPVRSPFELTVYFTSISMGIIAGVSNKLLLLLVVVVTTIMIFLVFASWFSDNFFKKELFHISFSEGNKVPSLSISSPINIDYISNSPNLTSINKTEGMYNYTLQSKNLQKLIEISYKVDQLEDVSYELVK
jgi:hypothetical protein